MSEQMVKSGLTDKLAEQCNIPYTQAEKAVEAFFESIIDGLAKGQRVEIRGFGSFTARQYKGYLGRNPRTGENVSVPPKVQAYYKPGKEIRDTLNK